ncbi:glycoside hydrolase family 114 protein [Thermothelomyces thermophilus ATCC 42464]|uniref:alpha-galactosidase n=1 Tax=Thermothelomyces thermophilus (strain ATCC 42464 / BCRC 31852 / DSM 1799) TaxID=573729 RepID=G2QJS1_THET4|nr:glycoside hydrolase family 114 protein [Thermothelomyces thermophilus ATCC 42464]AEO59827.1 glycoside hydrolase family 114 protein [Thermothelomyces thermophilus ATCC 42464]
MKRAVFLLAAASAIRGSLAQVRVPPNFEVGVKWQIVIQSTIDVNPPLEPADAVVWDLDLYHVARTPEVVSHLRENNPNTILICYFNAGLTQKSDCDYETRWEKSGLLGNVYDPEEPQFDDERWVNIKNQTARDWIKERITLARDVGCDGVDPDNIDGYHNDEDGNNGTGWDLSRDDYVSFVRELAEHAHGLTTKRNYTLLIGQKNAPDLVEDVGDLLDFAVLEDCKSLNGGGGDDDDDNDDNNDDAPFCGEFQHYIERGRPVFSIEYPSTLGDDETGECNAGGASKAQYEASCDASTARGNSDFSTVLKIQGGVGELNGCTQYCDGLQPGTGIVVTATDSELDGNECPPEATGSS